MTLAVESALENPRYLRQLMAAVEEVAKEHGRQERKHGQNSVWHAPLLLCSSALGEESGEVQGAINDFVLGVTPDTSRLEEEAIQAAACALAVWIRSRRGDWKSEEVSCGVSDEGSDVR